MITVVASGGFDPLHVGHIEYLQQARALGDRLVVIVNSDEFLVTKKGYAFMPQKERLKIIEALKGVDFVVACMDKDHTVCETLKWLSGVKSSWKPDIFAKGGDRTADNIPEKKVCDELGIKIVDGLGKKIQSSSELVKKMPEEAQKEILKEIPKEVKK